jgi:hypothetical protein
MYMQRPFGNPARREMEGQEREIKHVKEKKMKNKENRSISFCSDPR